MPFDIRHRSRVLLDGKDVTADRPPPHVNLLSQKMGIHEWSYDNDISLDLRYKVPHAPNELTLRDVKVEVELGFRRVGDRCGKFGHRTQMLAGAQGRRKSRPWMYCCRDPGNGPPQKAGPTTAGGCARCSNQCGSCGLPALVHAVRQ